MGTANKGRIMRESDWPHIDTAFHGLRGKLLRVASEQADRMISLSLASVPSALETSDSKSFRKGGASARRIVDHLDKTYGIDARSADYLAGRAAALAEVLDLCAGATMDPVRKTLSTETYSELVMALVDGPKRNIDLITGLGRDKGHISRLLREMREHGIVETTKRGRTNYSSLTPAGQKAAVALRSETTSLMLIRSATDATGASMVAH